MEAILKESHENRWLEQGWYLALQFVEGWVCFRITGREPANLRPYSLGAVTAGGNLGAWNEILDGSARRILEPHNRGYIYDHFWGVTPAKAKIYTQAIPRADIGSLVAATRTITGDIGYVDGDMSPYDGPFSPKTELVTIRERSPAFNAHNPLASTMANVMLAFDTMKYTYQVIKSRTLISDLLTGQRRVKKYTMGPTDPNPMSIPNWLRDLVTKTEDLLAYSRSVMEAE